MERHSKFESKIIKGPIYNSNLCGDSVGIFSQCFFSIEFRGAFQM